jgi:hypothetical protein
VSQQAANLKDHVRLSAAVETADLGLQVLAQNAPVVEVTSGILEFAHLLDLVLETGREKAFEDLHGVSESFRGNAEGVQLLIGGAPESMGSVGFDELSGAPA